jgi:hypothetical protein
VGGFFGLLSQQGASGPSGPATLGARLAYASPAGSAVAAAPAGFGTLIGRLLVTLPSGSATWISLTAGADGQLLAIRNTDAAQFLTLPAADWGGIGDLVLGPGNNILTYYDSTAALWQVTAP